MSDGLPRILRADSSGRILDAGGPGRALCLRPAVAPTKAGGENVGAVQMPGAFPVTVKLKGGGKAGTFPVINSDVHFFAPGDAFKGFDVVDCDASDTWEVTVWEESPAGRFSAPTKALVPVAIQDTLTAVPTAAPSLSTDGFPMRPGFKRYTLFFAGTARSHTLWVRKLDGVWFDTGIIVSDQTATTERVVPMDIHVPGDRFALRASGASQTLAVEGTFEVG